MVDKLSYIHMHMHTNVVHTMNVTSLCVKQRLGFTCAFSASEAGGIKETVDVELRPTSPLTRPVLFGASCV